MKNSVGTLSQVSRAVVLLTTGLASLAVFGQSQADITAPEPAPSASSTMDNMIQALPADELQWLETGGKRFFALWRPDTSGEPLGALLIVHGRGQLPTWPLTVDAIRVGLNQHGWGTLAIHVPEAPQPKIPKRPGSENASNEPQKSADDGERQKIFEQRKIQQLRAAMDFLASKGQYNIVIIGHGTGARWTLNYWRSITDAPDKTRVQKAQTIRSLIMIDPDFSTDDESYLAKTDQLTLPVLDICFSDRQVLPVSDNKSTRAKRLPDYYRISMLSPTRAHYGARQNRLAKRVRSFLHRHARGVEVTRN